MEDNRNYTDECGDHGGRNADGDPCGNAAGWGTPDDSGKCRHHRGTSPDGSSHEGNDWGATHHAYSQSFVEDWLREDEIERVEQLQDILEIPEGAVAYGRLAVGIAMEQFRRSGDERFLRRAESIADTFGIAPEDELQVEHSGSVDHEHRHELDETQRAHLDAITDGPAEIDVEPVDEA